ncbi:MAG TPA: hypothetical protein VIJ19_00820 [Opitutaceae bacterium]
MNTPSVEEIERIYPIEAWCRDLSNWVGKGKLTAKEHPLMVEYYQREQAANPSREENCARMWMALAFIQSYLPELVRAGAARPRKEGVDLPQSLVTALYRAFMSPAGFANPRGITVPLILEVIRDQKAWNEDRT